LLLPYFWLVACGVITLSR